MVSGASEIDVLAFSDPFRECKPLVAKVQAGQTIVEIIGNPDVPAIIQSDGKWIDAEYWHEVVPTSRLIIHRVPEGNIGRILGTIAIIALAAVAGPLAATALGFTTSAGALTTAGLAVSAGIQATVGIVGMLALNALIPPPTPSLGSGGGVDQLPTISAQSNQVRPFAPIPRPYGKLTWFPPIPMTALPYTELQGQDQHLRMMLCLGYGPLEIGGVRVGGASDDMIIKRAPATPDFPAFDFLNNGWTSVDTTAEAGEETSLTGTPIKIGGTSISQFEDVEFEIGRPDQISLYTQAVVEQVVNVSMPLSTENPPTGRDVTIVDDQKVVRTTDSDTSEVSMDLFFPSLFNLDSRGRSKWAKITFRIEYSVSGANVWTQAGPDWVISGRERRPVRQGRRVVLPSAGTWDIRLTRVQSFLERSGGDNTWVVDATWTVLRSIKRGSKPFDVPGTVVMALKIRATEQISGRLDSVSVETTSILPVFDGSAWVEQATRLAAWVYTDILSGSATRTPLPKSKVDDTAIKSWADFCDTENLFFDGVIESEGTVLDRARDAASVGFGTWSVEVDGKIGVVRDVPGTSRILITPRNTSDFKVEHVYPDVPHALRVQYTDPDTLERVERVVYDDGYSRNGAGGTTAATKFEQLETIGVRDPDIAWKMGRYHLAQLRKRRETYHWRHDIQHLAYKRGQPVDIAYDVILVGMKWGRIKAVTTDINGDATSVEVDELLVMQTGTDYALKGQRSDGTMFTQRIETVSGGTHVVSFIDGATGDPDPVPDVSVGDHFIFGEAGKESLPARISKIDPLGNLKARVVAVPAADNIFDAWTGTIPPFDPVITRPVDESLVPPPVPEIVSVTSGRDAAFQQVSGAESLRLAIAFLMPPGLSGVSVEARIRQHETIDAGEVADDWKHLTPVPYDAGKVIHSEAVEEGQIFDIQLRALNSAARASSWSTLAQKTIGGALVFDRVGGQNLIGSNAGPEASWTDTNSAFAPLDLSDIAAEPGGVVSVSAQARSATGADQVRLELRYYTSTGGGGSIIRTDTSPVIESATYGTISIEAAEIPATAASLRVQLRNLNETETAYRRRAMLNLGPTALPFEEPPARVGRGEVDLGADVTADSPQPPSWLSALIAAGDIDAASVEAVLNALNLIGGPDEAGAEKTTGKSLAILIDRVADNIDETAGRKWGADSGATLSDHARLRLTVNHGCPDGPTVSTAPIDDWTLTRSPTGGWTVTVVPGGEEIELDDAGDYLLTVLYTHEVDDAGGFVSIDAQEKPSGGSWAAVPASQGFSPSRLGNGAGLTRFEVEAAANNHRVRIRGWRDDLAASTAVILATDTVLLIERLRI